MGSEVKIVGYCYCGARAEDRSPLSLILYSACREIWYGFYFLLEGNNTKSYGGKFKGESV